MMKARDFRARARAALKGKWAIAVLVTLLAAILGGTIATTMETSLTVGTGAGITTSGNSQVAEQVAEDNTYTIDVDFDSLSQSDKVALAKLATAVSAAAMVSIAFGVLYIAIGGAISFGYARFQFHLLDGEEARFGDLFSDMRLGKGLGMRLLMVIYLTLWSLLFIIPGIIKSFSYAMTPYIMAENPEMRANEAINASRKLMKGNKWRLFCMELSFIGWDILCVLTMGIGNLILNPYKEAAHAVFYREIKQAKPQFEG